MVVNKYLYNNQVKILLNTLLAILAPITKLDPISQQSKQATKAK